MRIATSLLIGLCLSCWGCSRATVEGTIPQDWPPGREGPIWIPVQKQWADGASIDATIAVDGCDETVRVVGQFERADAAANTPARVWLSWAPPADGAGKNVTFHLQPTRAATPAWQSSFVDPHSKIGMHDGQPVLSYWTGTPMSGQVYPLCDFIHPVVGLDGEILTAQSPADHIHHRGIFWTWVRNERDGKLLGDWWAPRGIHLTPLGRCHTTGPALARITADHEWIHQSKDMLVGEPFLREHVALYVHRDLPSGRLVDFSLTLDPLQDGIAIGGQTAHDKGYGGFTFRFAKAEDVHILTDRGPVPKDANRYRARWADYTGKFQDDGGAFRSVASGAAMLVPQGHPEFPPDWVLRPYGILNVSYPGLGMVAISKEKPLRLNYRLWIHRGQPAADDVEGQWRMYNADWNWKEIGN